MERYENQFKGLDTNRLQKLNKARREVEHLVDKLGKEIDAGIKETISILRAMDFPTSSSCAGHTEPQRYGPPYVEVCAPALNDWKESEEKKHPGGQKTLSTKSVFYNC